MFNNHLSVKRMVELEEKIKQNPPIKFEDFANIIELQNKKEANYILTSYAMPFEQIKNAILDYENSTSKADELVFIQNLCERYGQERKLVLQRIRDVKRIDKYRKKRGFV